MKFAMLLIWPLITAFALPALSGERITTKSVAEFTDFVLKKKSQLGNEQLLVIYDFDNTLMAMNRDLGSDQWFNWQAGLLRNHDKKDAVAADFGELFRIHSKIFALGAMHPVEKGTLESVQKVQASGLKNFVLTSRGSSLRGDVEQELDRGGFDFSLTAPGPEHGYPGTFSADGLDPERPISYMDGIVMSSGQNKGKVLRALLKKMQLKIKAVAFLDDSLKNIENMENEMKNDVDLYTFYYTHEAERVQKFEKDKSQAKKDWKALKPVLQIFKEE